MANYNRPILAKEEIELFSRINRHGFVDMQYIYRFYKTSCNKKTVEGRIQQLAKHKYLSVINTFTPPEWTSNNRCAYKIITLGIAGQDVLRELGSEVVDYGKTLRTKSPYRMYHQVQVSTVTEVIASAYNDPQKSKFTVFRILSEKEIMSGDQRTELRNMPDALILMRNINKPGLFALFIEVERSYASMEHLQHKIKGYEKRIAENQYVRHLHLPIIHTRILFVSQTDSQFDVLREKLKKLDYMDQTKILLCKYQDICNHPLNEIYLNLKQNHYMKLMQKM